MIPWRALGWTYFYVGSGTFEQGKDEMDSSLTVQKQSSYNQWVAPGVPFVLFHSEIKEHERAEAKWAEEGINCQAGYEVVPTDPIFCWSPPLKM